MSRARHASNVYVASPAPYETVDRLGWAWGVEHHTVEWGANKFCVDLDLYTVDSIDAALLDYAQRVEPGKLRVHRQVLANAPPDLDARVEHHLDALLGMLYRVIEPARVRALDEMYRLTLGTPNDDEIRGRIAAYLGDGPLAAILLDGAVAATLDLPSALRALETVPPIDPFEWAGAAGRQLEAYPDHPLLLAARALGEAWLPNGDRDVFAATFARSLAVLPNYEVPVADAVALAVWALAQLRDQFDGRRWEWSPAIYDAWSLSTYPHDGLNELDHFVLLNAQAGLFHPHELESVLARRMRLIAAEAARFTGARTGAIPTSPGASSP